MEHQKKLVTVRGRQIGGDQPLICTPLVGKSMDQILVELDKILAKEPDIIEWRADFFEGIADYSKVMDTLCKIRKSIDQIPLLFTIRSVKEGGQPISLTEAEKIQLLTEVCKSNQIDIMDYEMVHDAAHISSVRDLSRESGVYLILSYHNFEGTPDQSFLVNKLREAEQCGADIAKISVMPTCKEDVLVLLNATQEAQKELTIPMVSISMGGFGAISRMIGWFFGSDFTFAIGEKSSAPGQMPIDDLRSAIQLLRKSMG